MKFLVLNEKGKKYLIEAPSHKLAEDAAVLDGGEIVATIHLKDSREMNIDKLADNLMELIDKSIDSFMDLPEIKTYWSEDRKLK